ncbi:MAG: YicC family protein [Oscillospiraceae bacterium]|nr:YicC family protein [Oscillospiraceae bacterium]
MVKSMTGYGRGEATLHGRTITIELKSVNNRYLDCSVRLPRAYAFAEEGVKSRVKAATSRGKVDVYVTVDATQADAVTVSLNRPLAESYLAALRTMSEELGVQNDVSVTLLSRFPDVLTVEKVPQDQEELSEDLFSVLDLALVEYDRMRTTEGEKLKEDLLVKLANMEQFVTQVEARSPETVREYRARLTAKLEEVLANTQIDESRILTEAAVFADKVAVDEETVRLRSHIAQFREMLEVVGIVGRKIDFLIQEMNRETNTIGSKCTDLTISRIVVDMKSEIEKLREQVQNLE